MTKFIGNLSSVSVMEELHNETLSRDLNYLIDLGMSEREAKIFNSHHVHNNNGSSTDMTTQFHGGNVGGNQGSQGYIY